MESNKQIEMPIQLVGTAIDRIEQDEYHGTMTVVSVDKYGLEYKTKFVERCGDVNVDFMDDEPIEI